MTFIKKNFLLSSISISSFITTSFVVSCSTSEQENTRNNIKEKLNNYLVENVNTFKATENINIKNFIEISSWNSVDDLTSSEKLGKYFIIEDSFKNWLIENLDVYSSIKKISIQPQENSKDLTIIFFLNSALNDGTIVSFKIINALSNNFTYENSISIDLKNPQEFYDSIDEFNNIWNSISTSNTSEINETNLKDILSKAYIIDETDIQKIVDTIKNGTMTIRKINTYQIELILSNTLIEQGYIFKRSLQNVSPFTTSITSNELVKQK